MAKMANSLRDFDRLAEENSKKARIFFQMGSYEEALAAYWEAEKAWKKWQIFFLKKEGGQRKGILRKGTGSQVLLRNVSF